MCHIKNAGWVKHLPCHESPINSRGGSYQKVKKLSPLIGVMIKFKVYETHFL